MTDIRAIQQDILRRLRAGEIFRTVHKEGGTIIAFRKGQWVREDYGEWSTHQVFDDEPTFLAFLREFFKYEVAREIAPAVLPDEEAWPRIRRLLQSSHADASRGVKVWGFVTVTAAAIVIGKLRIMARGRAPVASIDALFYPALLTLAACVVVAAIWLRRNWK